MANIVHGKYVGKPGMDIPVKNIGRAIELLKAAKEVLDEHLD